MINYIVRNCPAIEAYCTCGKYYDSDKQISTRCKDITDCLLKQIVDKCKDYKLIAYEGEFYKLIQENAKAKEILELLEIEEVDE